MRDDVCHRFGYFSQFFGLPSTRPSPTWTSSRLRRPREVTPDHSVQVGHPQFTIDRRPSPIDPDPCCVKYAPAYQEQDKFSIASKQLLERNRFTDKSGNHDPGTKETSLRCRNLWSSRPHENRKMSRLEEGTGILLPPCPVEVVKKVQVSNFLYLSDVPNGAKPAVDTNNTSQNGRSDEGWSAKLRSPYLSTMAIEIRY